MGILDSIVEWIATQIMNLLDLVTGSVLGALGCDMSTFLRYFPAAETLYEVFAAIAVGFILLNLVWQLFKNFGLGVGLSAEDPTKLAIKSILFIFLALFADQIMVLILGIAGTPYDWVVDTALPPIEFSNFGSVLTVIVGCLASGSVSLIVLILVIIIAWNYIKLLFEAAERYILVGVLIYTAPIAFATGASESTSNVFRRVVPNAWWSAFPFDHECMVPAPVHKHGWQLPCQSAVHMRGRHEAKTHIYNPCARAAHLCSVHNCFCHR